MRWPITRLLGLAVLAASGLLGSGCGSLLPEAPPPPAFFALDLAGIVRPAVTAATAGAASGPTLLVQPTLAAAGFDSTRMLYTRKAHQLEYYAKSEWIDTPARMLSPLVLAAVSDTGAFRAVVLSPSAAAGDMRLETELLRLQQEFGSAPVRVRLALRATLTDNATRRLMARQDFEVLVDSPSADAYGGVLAANRASHQLLQALGAFCAEAARKWQPGAAASARTHDPRP